MIAVTGPTGHTARSLVARLVASERAQTVPRGNGRTRHCRLGGQLMTLGDPEHYALAIGIFDLLDSSASFIPAISPVLGII